jgi:hypothetical protein
MWRVLRPGANVLLNVPFFYWLHETPHDYYRYTEFALRRFAESARFRILVLDAIGGVPEVVTDLFAKQLQTIPAIGASLAIAAQSAVGLYLRTSFGKKTSQKTGKAFPLGYFMVAEKTTA